MDRLRYLDVNEAPVTNWAEADKVISLTENGDVIRAEQEKFEWDKNTSYEPSEIILKDNGTYLLKNEITDASKEYTIGYTPSNDIKDLTTFIRHHQGNAYILTDKNYEGTLNDKYADKVHTESLIQMAADKIAALEQDNVINKQNINTNKKDIASAITEINELRTEYELNNVYLTDRIAVLEQDNEINKQNINTNTENIASAITETNELRTEYELNNVLLTNRISALETDNETTKQKFANYYTKEEINAKEWVGTLEEYEALTEKDNNVTYYIVQE